MLLFPLAKLAPLIVAYLRYRFIYLSYIRIRANPNLYCMEDTAIPYELPEAENHSFFFIDQRIETSIEAKLHRHDAWELYYVVHGQGNRTAGDTLQPFAAGDVALIPRPCFTAGSMRRTRRTATGASAI